MQNLRITVIQPDIIWEDSRANLNKYSELIAETEPTDVIVLPEMFTTGFSMNPKEISETMTGTSVTWMKKVAKEKDAALIGSLIIKEENRFYNRGLWVSPDGEIQKYDKRHLFSMGQEPDHFTAGTEKLIVEYKGWRFCPLICYDLRFPVWSRNRNEYDVLIYLANWPAARHRVWKNLLTARAIENQAYCIGVNRVGTDGPGLKYSGDSALVSPKGFAEYLGEKEAVKTFEISLNELRTFRKNFPVLNDGDDFKLYTE